VFGIDTALPSASNVGKPTLKELRTSPFTVTEQRGSDGQETVPNDVIVNVPPDVNVWIVLPPEVVIVPPVAVIEPVG
jgi:hypothetical protein